MKIHIIKNGKKVGPHSRSEIMALIRSGQCRMSDPGCREGRREKLPLSEIFEEQAAENTNGEDDGFLAPQLLNIAQEQESLARYTFLSLFFGFLPGSWLSTTVSTWCFVVFHLVAEFKCHLLAESLRKNKWLWTLAALVPLINLVPIWRILSEARKALRKQGVPAT